MKWLPGFSKYCHIVQIVYKLFVTDGGDNKCNLHRKGKSFSYLYYISWLSNIDMYLCTQCGFKCLLGRNQKIETKLGCENKYQSAVYLPNRGYHFMHSLPFSPFLENPLLNFLQKQYIFRKKYMLFLIFSLGREFETQD